MTTINTNQSPLNDKGPGTDLRPTQGRVYGYLAGGKDAYSSEQALGQALTKIFPGMGLVARQNRACINKRVPAFLAEQGFSQFLDLGCGLPQDPLLHTAAKKVKPWARVAYVDNDEVVLSHARHAYGLRPGLAVVNADIADIDSVLQHPDLIEVFDPDQQVAAIAGAVLHFLPDEAAARVIEDLAANLAAGSVLAFTHATGDGSDEDDIARARELYEQHVGPIYLRSAEQILSLLGDRRLIAGLVRTYELLPEHPDDVELVRSSPAPHFYAAIVELSRDPLRETLVPPTHCLAEAS